MKLMKRKLLPAVLAMTGLVCGTVCGCGETADNSISTQNTLEESREADDGLGAKLTSERQLALIEDNQSIWYVEPSEEWICYVGISDFDENGRLELTVSREEAGSCVNTQFYMYEVNEDGSGITKVNVDLGDATRMPDISLNNVINCYRGSDGSLSYAITDSNMSDYSIYEYENYLMTLNNGTLKCESFSRMVCNLADDENPEKYYDAAGNALDAMRYKDAEAEYVNSIYADGYDSFNQMLSFHYYEDGSDFADILQMSYDNFKRMDDAEYAAYVAERYDSNSSVSMGMADIGSLYYTDIDEAYLKNKRWSSFYISNFETGVETDYINNGGAGSRFEKELIFFGNDGTGYYMDIDGNIINFEWTVNDIGSAEAVCEGDDYRNSVFGYTLIDNDGNEHQAIAFEYKNEYIYSMCE